MADHPPTRRLYFDDTRLLEAQATLVGVENHEDGRVALILDSTVFHPAGGGQPTDTGTIGTSLGPFLVRDVAAVGEVIKHWGALEEDGGDAAALPLPQEVELKVDEEPRLLHARIHSGGHLLDKCMEAAGQGHLEPGKGHHAADGPYVEYKGKIEKEDQPAVKEALEEAAAELIKAGGEVSAKVAGYDEAAGLCGGKLPPYIPADASPRIVVMAGVGCPCGGTHVKDVSEIQGLEVTGFRVRKGITRISYTVPGLPGA